MAKFEDAAMFLRNNLEAKELSMDNSKAAFWFTSHSASYQDLFDKFDFKEDDQVAYQTYQDIKNPDARVPVDKEKKYRLRLLFLAALKSQVRQQYMCGPGNRPRNSLQSYRYEMSNAQAVRCCLNKFDRIQKAMAEEAVSGGAH